MVTAKELHEKAMEKMKTFDVHAVLPALRKANDGAIEDVLNTNGCANYQWWPCLIEEVMPKQVVELGGAMGVGTIMMLQSKYQDFKLYSITLPENGLEFSYIADNYPNLTKVVGDDLDLSNWPKDLDLKQTDIWYFDSEHTYKQLKAELDLYSPFFKKGAVLVFDDIRMEGLWELWESLPYDKIELTNPLHYTGYGMAVINK